MRGSKEGNTDVVHSIVSEVEGLASGTRSVGTTTDGIVDIVGVVSREALDDVIKHPEGSRIEPREDPSDIVGRLATRKKGLQQGAASTVADGGVKGGRRKRANPGKPSILEPGNLDQLLNSEVASKSASKRAGSRRGKKNTGKKTTSEKKPLKRKLEYGKGLFEWEDYVPSPPVERSPFFVRLEKSAFMTGAELPEFMQMYFRPPQDMKLDAIEMAVAAYIFGQGLDTREVLYPQERVQGDREAFWSLRPGQDVYDDVLNLVAKDL
ncbi:hypothetical protein PIB30_006644 [Stylosanthes scabra]|uniref:Uncharacterized protein n=1 Tax=Stylosanthes scabra TaxID=79078 RepID=A0ABU6Q5A1_9FABA|nr:hypothetical protein [Stylosanthes scabra]